MRNVNVNVLSASDHLTSNSSAIDAGQLVSASFHAYFGDTSAAGTLKLQASNDVDPFGKVPTHWVDVPSQSAAVTSGGSVLITLVNNAYRWLRAVYTTTATGAQTVAPIADTGVKQTQTITAIADVASSLNSQYFLVSSVNLVTKAQKNFYVWFDNGAGVDPAIAGCTGVTVVYAADDSATVIGGLVRDALALLTDDFTITGATTGIIITNKAFGPVTAAVDGVATTGFTFGTPTLGVASNLNNKYFLLNSANSGTGYYVWNNVDGLGTDPAVAGRTGVEIAFTSGASAGTIGTAMASAVDALANFLASGTTTVTVTNSAGGPFVPISDGNSGYTFAVTGGGTTTVTVNLNALSI